MFAAGNRSFWLNSLVAAGFALMPLAVFGMSVQVRHAAGPYWLSDNSDPDYQYLCSSLLLATGRAPYHVDHPGITLHLFGAFVLRVTHLCIGSGPIAMHVLANSEFYLATINVALAALYGVVLWVSGLLAYRVTGRLSAGFLMQLTPWIFIESIAALGRVSPEPLLGSLSALLGLGTLLYCYAAPAGAQVRFARLFGVCLGLLLATKVTALPLLALPLVLLRTWRERRIYVVAVGVSLLVVTLPICVRYRGMASWLWRIATHSGQYGHGAPSIIDMARFGPALWMLLSGAVLVVIVALSSLVSAWLSRLLPRSDVENPTAPMARRAVLGIALVQVLQFLMVAKHPAAHYLLPALGLTGVQLVLSCELLGAANCVYRLRPVWIFAMLLTIGLLQGLALAHRLHTQAVNRDVCMELHDRTRVEFPREMVVRYYRSSSLPFALDFGNTSAGGRFTRQLQVLYPDAVTYDIWQKSFARFCVPLTEDEMASARARAVWIGTPFEGSRLPYLPANLVLEQVDGNAKEAVYRVHPAEKKE